MNFRNILPTLIYSYLLYGGQPTLHNNLSLACLFAYSFCKQSILTIWPQKGQVRNPVSENSTGKQAHDQLGRPGGEEFSERGPIF